jgi:hypothetical protein
MKKTLLTLLVVLLMTLPVYAQKGWVNPDGPYKDANCAQAKYYGYGKICQSTVTGTLYKGTGTGITEITSGGLATNQETVDGTDSTKAVTPAGLAAKIDTDGTLAGNLDTRIPSQKAVKTYSDTKAAIADLATDNSTASHALYKDASGNIANQVLSIDAHAGSTTIALIPGICPVIHNTAMGDANVANSLPAVAEGLCFTALITTAENDKTWRFTAAAVDTICLGTTCGKDDIGFATTKVVKGAMFKCVAQGTEWFCNTITGEPDAGDL